MDSLGNIWQHIIRGLEISAHCDCCWLCAIQTLLHTYLHIVNKCPVSKLHDGGLHSADSVAVNWLERTALKAHVSLDKTVKVPRDTGNGGF